MKISSFFSPEKIGIAVMDSINRHFHTASLAVAQAKREGGLNVGKNNENIKLKRINYKSA
jgi:hypothetical protein